MLIFDGDYPMALGVAMNRDLTAPIEEVRAAERLAGTLRGWPDSEVMATIPEMRRGEIGVALVKTIACIKRPGHKHGECRSDEIAYAQAKGHIAYYHMLEAKGDARILTTGGDVEDHMDKWLQADTRHDLPIGMVLGMEGADAILWPEQVHEWWNDGVRVISLSHYGVSRYSHGTGTGTTGGLLPGAKELLREMESLGMILDISHTSDESVRQELEIFSGPIIASHQNCRAIVPGERQMPDDMMKQLFERDGIIGHSMDVWMLWKEGVDWGNQPSRRETFPRSAVTLNDFADHVDYSCQLAGDSLHTAIGGDTDGQGGRDGAPYEIDTVADYQRLEAILERRGYSKDDIANIFHRNWQRFFQKWLPS